MISELSIEGKFNRRISWPNVLQLDYNYQQLADLSDKTRYEWKFDFSHSSIRANRKFGALMQI